MALFSRKHYETLTVPLRAIAKTIYNNETKFSWVVQQLADELERDNRNFDRTQFFQAIFNDAEIKAWRIK